MKGETMNQELARKRPAIVVGAHPILTNQPTADVLVLRGLSRTALASEVSRLWQNGRIEREYDLGYTGTFWVARCTVKPPAGWWRRNGVRVAGAATALGVAGIAAWLILKALAVLAVILVPALVILAVVAVILALAGSNHYTQVMNIRK
jgi:hypothetical protein